MSEGTRDPQYFRLFRYARRHTLGWIAIIVCTLIGSGMAVVYPWPMKVLVDHVINNRPVGGMLASAPWTGTKSGLLAWVVAAGLVIFLVNSLADAILTFAWIRVGQRMVFNLTQDLFAAVQRRSLRFHSRSSVGDLLSRITGDSWALYSASDSLLFTPGYALINAVCMIAVMLRMDAGLTLLSVALAPFLAVAVLLLGRPARKVAEVNRALQGRLHAHVHQTLRGIPIVQAFVQEDRERRRFETFTSSALRVHRHAAVVEQSVQLATGLATTFATAAVLWFGAVRVSRGALSIGDLLVFLAYLAVLQSSFKTLSGVYTQLQSTRAMLDRVIELLDAPAEVRDLPDAIALGRSSGDVLLDRVTFGYDADRAVLSDVSLHIKAGQVIAIVGATGAGKSTLVSLIPRFIDPWQGRVLIDGQDARDLSLASLRRNVAMLLQDPFLFPITIAQNIAYGRPDASQEQIEAAAKAARAHEFISALPEGYGTVLGESGATLSGGERQRLSIARALLKDAPILILDEPTSALDAQTETELLQALEYLMKGRTTLIIAHRLSTVRHADRIIVLEAGRIVEQGTHHELLAGEGIYSRLHRLGAGEPEPVLAAIKAGAS